MRTNVTMYRAVGRAVHWPVDGAVFRAVTWAVYDTMWRTVNGAVNGAGPRPVYAAVTWAVSGDPPHPALADFLSDAARGAP